MVEAQVPPGTTRLMVCLFVDMEGSTRLLERLGSQYPEVLMDYRRILTDAIESSAGEIIGTAGDGLFAGFPAATGAVAAAIAAQLGMAGHRWPGGATVKARMGIHVGEVLHSSAGYIGLDIHRTARISAAAHGGQVLLSSSTLALVEGSMPPDFGVRDLGEHRLAGLSRPERLYQLTGVGLEHEFPPIRTLRAATSNLPLPLSSFVGRETELTELVESTTRHRLVTVTGPGGGGKTRLALQAASAVVDDFPDGVWLALLGTAFEPERVPGIVAQALGVAVRPGATAEDALVDELVGRRLLLVLDNCEHLLEAVARLTTLLLRHLPSVSILATSRERLGTPGEWVIETPLLSLPPVDAGPNDVAASEAGRLLVERGAAVRPGFVANEDNAGALAAICRQLDGIPLALELAAARLRVLAPDELAARLADRFQLLTGGPRGELAHHRTLEDTLAWSYDLLNEPERAVFRRLGVFRGGATLTAAESVCGDDRLRSAEVFQHCSSLAGKSLLSAEQALWAETRFGMLETIRAFALRQMSAGEAEQARQRHARHYVRLAEAAEPALRTEDEATWMDRLDADIGNIRDAVVWSLGEGNDPGTALRIAAALKTYLIARDHLVDEARDWLEHGLAAAPDLAPGYLARAHSTAGALAWNVGALEEAERHQRACLEFAERTGDREAEFRSRNDLGLIAVDRGLLGPAREHLAAALNIATRAADPEKVAVGSSLLALVEPRPRQRQLLDQAAELLGEIGRSTGIAHVLMQQAWLSLAIGDGADAAQRFDASRGRWEAVGNTVATALCRCGRADVHLAAGSAADAEQELIAARALAAEAESVHVAGLVDCRLAVAALLRDDLAEARHRLEGIVDASSAPAYEGLVARAHGLVALTCLEEGKWDEGLGHQQSAADLWAGLNRIDGLAWAAAAAGRLHHARGDLPGALAAYLEACRRYAGMRAGPAGLDGWLSPEPGYHAEVVEAVSGAALALVDAGHPRIGSTLLRWAAAESDALGLAASRGFSRVPVGVTDTVDLDAAAALRLAEQTLAQEVPRGPSV